ncbi:MAG TPA: sigma 54-interacting transcriptional regulator [Candidatus Polarisedimenticolia bacterium]|jgi:transcriptional regulator with GAF, ATPase, and Fis domain|nr:sigma 54-interacting transcriptional regulator [Candidatus Polarisedimenticolia bacterium]
MEADRLLSLAVAVAAERTVEGVLQTIVRGLATHPGVALARIWLRLPGDICDSCFLSASCRDRTQCFHLVASAGTPAHSPGEDWSSLQGGFRRIPESAFKVGLVGATGKPLLFADIASERELVARPEWVRREGIRSFAGHPFISRGQVLGVLATFTREPLDERAFAWLGMFANQAAVAIENARVFEELDRLRKQLEMENAYLHEQVKEGLAFGEIVGRSQALQEVLQQVDMVARTDTTVLLTGESGTGKELAARAIHERGGRRDRPLVTVNCASVPRDLFESEFFGHVRGAFTGALRDRVGRFQLADRGTIFLDEVGEIPLALQSKLLRVLQEKQIERVGENLVRQLDVRVIAATNQDLRQECEAGRFRRDLYYRLSVFPIELPPLRRRPEDIGLLAAHFLTLAASRLNFPEVQLTDRALEQLTAYDWPGNIRELRNVIERAVILSQSGPLRIDRVLGAGGPVDRVAQARLPADVVEAPGKPAGTRVLSRDELARQERDNLLSALEQSGWKISGRGGAAELLGVKPTTLTSRLKRFGIERQH